MIPSEPQTEYQRCQQRHAEGTTHWHPLRTRAIETPERGMTPSEPQTARPPKPPMKKCQRCPNPVMYPGRDESEFCAMHSGPLNERLAAWVARFSERNPQDAEDYGYNHAINDVVRELRHPTPESEPPPIEREAQGIPPPLPGRSCRHGIAPDQCEFCEGTQGMTRVNLGDHWEAVYRLTVEIAKTTRSPDVRRWAHHIQYLAADGRFGRSVADQVMGRWPFLQVVPPEPAAPPSKKVGP